ncbi:MAG: hypothetical protein PHW02_02470 [bacterium]|nr:hypothetical protein [bacterium]
MHKERRESLPVISVVLAAYIVTWVKGNENYWLLLAATLLFFFWIFFPSVLRLFSFIFSKLVRAMAFLTTLILIALVYYVLFLLFKPILYFSDKRFFRKRESGSVSYYIKANNEWEKNIKELF